MFVKSAMKFLTTLCCFDRDLIIRDFGRTLKLSLINFRENKEKNKEVLEKNLYEFTSEDFDEFLDFTRKNKLEIKPLIAQNLKEKMAFAEIKNDTNLVSPWRTGTLSNLVIFPFYTISNEKKPIIRSIAK
jgi:hypothetical protein